ncbi:MAG: aminoacetone oxidase family FAD-binding enzyme [Gemmatimonadaceae bacterium]|nr:aminoacetone oxidase family FAD-binding enzyme [Gemmatimonadaceae bacterium]
MKEVLVIGAGAAGTMAAIFAARGGASVTLLERTRDGGRKILISGGGRCNVLPSRIDEARFVTDSSPNVLRRIIRSWPLADQIRFFEQDLGIPLEHEEESLKLFPASHKARDVRDGLLDCAVRSGVRLITEVSVVDVVPAGRRWHVACEDGRVFDADAVIIATGGLSVPATGSDGRGLSILRKLGHTIHPTYAALTPLTVEPNAFTELAGISLPVTLTARSGDETGKASGGFLSHGCRDATAAPAAAQWRSTTQLAVPVAHRQCARTATVACAGHRLDDRWHGRSALPRMALAPSRARSWPSCPSGSPPCSSRAPGWIHFRHCSGELPPGGRNGCG